MCLSSEQSCHYSPWNRETWPPPVVHNHRRSGEEIFPRYQHLHPDPKHLIRALIIILCEAKPGTKRLHFSVLLCSAVYLSIHKLLDLVHVSILESPRVIAHRVLYLDIWNKVFICIYGNNNIKTNNHSWGCSCSNSDFFLASTPRHFHCKQTGGIK